MLYNSLIIVVLMGCISMLISIRHNSAVDTLTQRSFSMIYLLVMVAAVCEWLGVALNYASDGWRFLHAAVKTIEYCITPLLPVLWANAVLHNERHVKWISILMGLHIVFEVTAAFFGWVFYLDADNVYRHGTLYIIYPASYLASALYLFLSSYTFSRKTQDNARPMLISILLFVVVGIAFPTVDSSLRISWVVCFIASILFYQLYSDVMQETDGLTGLLNRISYEKAIASIDYPTAVLMFDVDNFKSVNDNYGHAFGDHVLKNLGSILLQAYSAAGRCYRIGGDEFCVILQKGRLHDIPFASQQLTDPDTGKKWFVPASNAELQKLNLRFDELIDAAHESDARMPGVSLGYAFFDGHGSLKDILTEADEAMYHKKRIRKAELQHRA